MSKRKSEKSENPRFYGQNKLFFSTLPFSPWAVLATWPHVGAPQKIQENELNPCFQQKFAASSYRVGIGCAWCSWKACKICSSLIQKKEMKKNKNSSHKLPKQQMYSFWSQGILGVN
jgi:hypothetical protein